MATATGGAHDRGKRAHQRVAPSPERSQRIRPRDAALVAGSGQVASLRPACRTRTAGPFASMRVSRTRSRVLLFHANAVPSSSATPRCGQRMLAVLPGVLLQQQVGVAQPHRHAPGRVFEHQRVAAAAVPRHDLVPAAACRLSSDHASTADVPPHARPAAHARGRGLLGDGAAFELDQSHRGARDLGGGRVRHVQRIALADRARGGTTSAPNTKPAGSRNTADTSATSQQQHEQYREHRQHQPRDLQRVAALGDAKALLRRLQRKAFAHPAAAERARASRQRWRRARRRRAAAA